MQSSTWKATKTIPNNDFSQAIKEMSQHQLDINMVEISLLALTNEAILKWMLERMHQYEFYLKYRYLLQNVMNGKIKAEKREQLDLILVKFDQRFINGEQNQDRTEEALMKMPFQKQQRLKFVQDKETVIKHLDELSGQLFTIEDQQEKRNYFQETITSINAILQGKDSEDNQEDTPSTNTLKGFIFCQQDSLRKLVNINLKSSFFIQTKNRNPLVLDFEFAPFLYKNDDQLSHQIIAMQYIKYFNSILGKEYIVPYQIIPEQIGALYEFIQDAITVHKIKEQHQNGLIDYFQKLKEKGSPQQVMNRFAETYSGFCLIQYMLDIKDRNNCNIMVKEDGSIFHIDLAFIFGAGPGAISFQSAPFKMPKEYIKVLGGFDSDCFRKFQSLLVQHFTKVLEFKKELLLKMNILTHRKKEIRCFKDYDLKTFQKKFPKNQLKVRQLVETLIEDSYDNWRTTKYDDFQFKTNDILK